MVAHPGENREAFLSALGHLQNDRYVLLKKLGEGGKGIVYKARDTILNRIVAIKMLKGGMLTEEDYSRFMREAQTVAQLNHPNIVSIYDIGKEGEKHFFVLEFVEGMSLRDLMTTYSEGKCDAQTILRIGIGICSALQYAHSQGVLHRDIKPENILITEEGVAKLMDFGLARMLGQPNITQEGIIIGTPAYVPPEIALGKGADARSDLYSFGAVLYETIAGRLLFPGEEPIKIIFGHIHDHPVSLSKLNPRVPQALADCIMKLLQKDPDNRYQTASDFLRVLKEIAESSLGEVPALSPKPRIVVPSPRRPALKEIQLIDRVEEMGVLREAVDRAVQGEGGVVFLYGEAGIGKTRLARELGTYARLRGMEVLYGRCPALFRMDGVPPYILWSEVIKDYLQACTPEHLYKVIGYYPSEVCKMVPEVRNKLGAIPPSLPISPEHERDRLFEAISQFMTNISKETPLLVILDDLQWTDQSSLLLLHYMTRGIQKESLFLLGDYRDTDVDEKHPLTPVLAEMNRERLFQSIRLERMSFDHTSQMVKGILEQDEVPEAFCQLVYAKTRGNPFFAEEVIKSLKEEKVIYREENRWKIKEVSKIEFPKTVKSVIRARIGRLDDECQNVLTLACFIGNDFSFEALHAVTGLEEDKLLEILEKALKTGLIKERLIRGEEVYSFADIIIRDAVHEEVSLLRHKRLHGAVGSALEKVYAMKIDEHLGELAYHFLEGGDKEKALAYFLKAADKAKGIYANNEAASYLRSALGLLEEKEGATRERARVLESLGDIGKLDGKYDDCIRSWGDALPLWKQSDERMNVARLHRKMAGVFWMNVGNREKAKEHHQEALKILEAEPESVELASLYEDMAGMVAMGASGGMAQALSLSEKAIDLAIRLNAYETIARSYVWAAEIHKWLGDSKRAAEYCEKSLKIALDNGYLETAAWAYDDLSHFALEMKRERRLELREKGFELAKKVGSIEWIAMFGLKLAQNYAEMGNLNKAISMLEESVSLSRKATNLIELTWSLGWLGLFYDILGETDKSELCLNEAFSISQGLDDFQAIMTGFTALGWSHFRKGEYAKAKELMEKGYEAAEKHGVKAIQWSRWIIRTYIELGETDKANALIESLQEFAFKENERTLAAEACLLKGNLLRAQKKWEDSIEQFDRGIKELEALGARQWDKYDFADLALIEYARVYLERNQEGDREKADKLLNEALGIFQKMGARKDIEKVIGKKKMLTA